MTPTVQHWRRSHTCTVFCASLLFTQALIGYMPTSLFWTACGRTLLSCCRSQRAAAVYLDVGVRSTAPGCFFKRCRNHLAGVSGGSNGTHAVSSPCEADLPPSLQVAQRACDVHIPTAMVFVLEPGPRLHNMCTTGIYIVLRYTVDDKPSNNASSLCRGPEVCDFIRHHPWEYQARHRATERFDACACVLCNYPQN